MAADLAGPTCSAATIRHSSPSHLKPPTLSFSALSYAIRTPKALAFDAPQGRKPHQRRNCALAAYPFGSDEESSERCPVQRAFSSMVFMVRELQSAALEMRSALFFEDLHGVLARVRREVNASFIWLFQKVFSCTPALMVSVMLLLANFTVYSIGLGPIYDQPMTVVAGIEKQSNYNGVRGRGLEGFKVKEFKSPFSASIGAEKGGGGGKAIKPPAGAAGDDWWDENLSNSAVADKGVVGVVVSEEEEGGVWEGMLQEVQRMRACATGGTVVEMESLRGMVAPVKVELEGEEGEEYLRTELMYCEALSQEPDNVMLLSNFAQFLYLVMHDHDRY